jgi:DNA helicase-2/ATP-dependent DNA helicase PcrA
VTLNQFGSAARKRLGAFRRLMIDLRDVGASGVPLGEIGAELVNQSGYGEMLQQDDTPEADARFQNVQELVASMDEFQRERPDATLADFLENVTLQTSADEQVGGDRVTLMTVHAAKGLEFPIVMVTGLEEQVFPFVLQNRDTKLLRLGSRARNACASTTQKNLRGSSLTLQQTRSR